MMDDDDDDDAPLLREFALRRDEASFRRVVERRIGFVYAVALRRLHHADLAQDATQAVFIALARKAARVAESPSVVGWLHRASCYESRNLMRAQINRLARESEAQRLGTTVTDALASGAPGQLEAVLDEVLNELPETDREAILARFFASRSFADIGAAMNRSENAARMRVDRALERLRERLHHRGFDSSIAVLTAALPACAGAATPAGLAGTVSASALTLLGTGAGSVTFLAAMTTSKIAVTAAAAALAAVGFAGYELNQTQALQGELAALRTERTQTSERMQGLERQLADVQARVAAAPQPAPTGTGAPASAVTPASPRPDIPGVTRGAPKGWHANGSKNDAFEVGVDANQSWGGMPSAYAKSISDAAEKNFGGMMQTISAEQYKNQRVKLSGWIKTQDATDNGGQLWLRIDGQTAANMLGFDNMNGRSPKGTTDWQEYSIVLDVPAEASSINYGYFLGGRGQMWVNAVTITPVGKDVPTTNMLDKPRSPLPQTPVNLGFAAAPKG